MEADMIQLMYQLNKDEALKRLPVILFLTILAIFGIVGNIHVWFIFKCHLKSSTYRVFVLFMAMIDIFCCFVVIPFEIVDELFPFAYTELISCKIFRFISTAVTMASLFMLVVISFERYGKIRTPDGIVMSKTVAIFSSSVVLIAATVFTFPAIYVYGRRTITNITEISYNGNHTMNVSVTGYDCTWGNNMEDTLYFQFYHVWILITTIGCMLILAVVYSLILATLGRNIILTRRYSVCDTRSSSLIPVLHTDEITGSKNKRLDQGESVSKHTDDRKRNVQMNENVMSIVSIVKTDHDENLDNSLEASKKNCKEVSALNVNDDNSATQKNGSSSHEISNDQKNAFDYIYSAKAQLLREKVRHATTVNEKELPVTKVAFALSLLFVVCCIPHIVCLIAYLSNASYVVGMSTPEHVLYLIGFRLHLINNVMKSVVYGCLDRQFRTNVVKVYRSFFARCKNLVAYDPK